MAHAQITRPGVRGAGTTIPHAGGLALVVAALATCPIVSCNTGLLSTGTPEESTIFRIENATGSGVEVRIELVDAEGNPIDEQAGRDSIDIPVVTIDSGNVSFSTLTPIGAAASNLAAQGAQPGAASVRVSGATVSEGRLGCGPIIRVSATVESTQAAVQFRGDGAGTPGFDEGSIGQTGERFLVEGQHFNCGDSVVIRVDDDGALTGGPVDPVAAGQIAVVQVGDASPFGSLPASLSDAVANAGDADSNGSAPPSTAIVVQVENLATVIADVSLTVSAGGDDEIYAVSVPPALLTEGTFSCGSQLTVAAALRNPDRPVAQPADEEFPDATIVFTGDGTGAPGFDELSVSPDGTRILTVGTHLTCGDTVRVTILDDGAVITPNGFNALGIGAGVVTVLQDAAQSGEEPLPETGEDVPDLDVTVVNQTGVFARVAVVGGVASLGQQLDVFVAPHGASTGAIGCSDRFTLSAYSLAESALTGLVDDVIVVLRGDGAGTAGFDDGSVGVTGQRLLLTGEHFDCGDSFVVTITDPGASSVVEPGTVDSNGLAVDHIDLNGNGLLDDGPVDLLGSGVVDVR